MTLDEKHIKRVTDEEASELFHDGGWRYVSKSLWKEKVRDIEDPPSNTKPTENKSNKMSKSQKRHLLHAKKSKIITESACLRFQNSVLFCLLNCS